MARVFRAQGNHQPPMALETQDLCRMQETLVVGESAESGVLFSAMPQSEVTITGSKAPEESEQEVSFAEDRKMN
jgi:hypothetical protein